MLQLQRASAGSGKTYTLAKRFIWFLIAIKEGERPWRLRNSREIADGVRRILAITFTNKATNEMKQRIVSKLSDLASVADGPVTENTFEDVAYLREFTNDLNVPPQTIGKVCGEALNVLLNDYSEFRVSTIDSFFQTILRTFAYESNLNDSYQVEIESDFLATEAVDSTLDKFNNPRKLNPAVSAWMRLLIDTSARKGEKWNVFQKTGGERSIYGNLIRAINKLESEEFKDIRTELDAYFSKTDGVEDPLLTSYLKINSAINTRISKILGDTKDACRRLKRLLDTNGLDVETQCARWAGGHMRKIMALDHRLDKRNFFVPLDMEGGKKFLKSETDCGQKEEIERTAFEMYSGFSELKSFAESEEMRHWNVYSPLLPYLGLLGECRREISSYLEQNNMIQLGETNSMLHRIIGDDDAPFVYERIGARLNHYLIDEFQDTSRMQWQNLRPLLSEADGRGEDNLIIGDAKQSIYRFRNADPSIITTTVPTEFPRHHLAGISVEDNTNWRSARRVVEFNNFFFQALARKLAGISNGTIDFEGLYSNVVQHPRHRDPEGYVEIRFARKQDVDLEDEEETEAHPEVCGLITQLVDRGYEFRDIAILVKTHKAGDAIIADIMAYNESVGEDGRKIDFISEESLLVSSAEAVQTIIGVLRKMADGRKNVSDLRSDILNENKPEDPVDEMLAGMQTVALPALVEAITENFVPVSLRKSQAVYIAGLQDIVLEYCDGHAADLGSFLMWWDTKGVLRSISSPEGTDAVEIMTYHKSKGLEFKCVILPEFDFSMTPTSKKSEWRWVRPSEIFSDFNLPPYMPVETKKDLLETCHSEEYERYHDLVIMDNLNNAYVAFTRAVKELYIFTSKPAEKEPKKKKSKSCEGKESTLIGYYLDEICRHPDYYVADIELTDQFADILPSSEIETDDVSGTIRIGTLPKVKTKEEKEKEESEEKKPDEFVIEEYGVDSSPMVLHYVESDDETSKTVTPEAADKDPRSEGNLLHEIMSGVDKREDLHRSVLRMKMQGMITSARADEWETMLADAMSSEDVSSWFGSGWKVFNERQFLIPGEEDRRPDRVMLSPDRQHAVIVDYKFGHRPGNTDHQDQVRKYMDLLHEVTGIEDVTGFIWYVRLGEVEKVEWQ